MNSSTSSLVTLTLSAVTCPLRPSTLPSVDLDLAIFDFEAATAAKAVARLLTMDGEFFLGYRYFEIRYLSAGQSVRYSRQNLIFLSREVAVRYLRSVN